MSERASDSEEVWMTVLAYGFYTVQSVGSQVSHTKYSPNPRRVGRL